MNKLAVISAVVLAIVPAGIAKDKKAENKDPVVWGLLSQNTGCVIFKEYRKTSGMFWGVAVTTKTVSALEVVETQNYTLEQTKWIETQENLDELQRRAVKDKLKYVKIPDKYSEEQLDKARAMCKEPSLGG